MRTVTVTIMISVRRHARSRLHGFSLVELSVGLTLIAALAGIGYATYHALLARDQDSASEAKLSQVAHLATADFVAARNWTEAFSGATENSGFTVVADTPSNPTPSLTPNQISYRAVSTRVGMAMLTDRGTCVMGLVQNRAVDVWTVKASLGSSCAGRVALMGEQAPAAYTAPTTALSAPTDLDATGGRGQVVLTWSGTGSSYEVTRDGKSLGLASSPYTDKAVRDGVTYSYAVHAVDASGNQSADAGPVSALTIPATPSGAAAAGTTSVTMQWNASSGTVTGYKVYNDVGLLVWQGAATSMTYSPPNTPGSLTVSAYNASGESLQSSAVQLNAALSAPRSLTGTAGDRAVSLTWATPATGRPTGYEVFKDGVSVLRVNATGASVTGLKNGTAYSFTVKAYNALSVSAASDPAVLTPGVSPQVLTSIAVSQCAGSDPGSIALSWALPVDDPDNPIQGFKVYQAGTSILLTEARMPLTTASVTGLTPGNAYAFDVKTWRTGGVSATSTSASVVAGCVPPNPSSPLVTVNPPTSATGSYGLVTGHPAVSSYEYRCSSTNGGAPVTATSASASVTSIAIAGLTTGKTYACTAYARNAIGYSTGAIAVPTTNANPANPNELFDTILPPNTPAAPALSGGNGSMSVSWSAVTATSSRPLSGYKVFLLTSRPTKCSDSATCLLPTTGTPSCTTAATSCTVSGLTNGVTYTAYVQSYNLTFYSDGPNSSHLILGSPAAPDLTADSATTSSLRLVASSASTTANPVSGYHFYRSGTHIGTSSGTLTDAGLAPGTQYCYTAVAYNAAFTSSSSSQICPWSAQNAPDTPSSSGWSTTSFVMSWTGVSGATSYDYQMASVGTWTTASTSATLSSLAACTWHTVYVRANGPWGTTAWSPAISVQTRCLLSVTDTFDSVQGYAGTNRWPAGSPYYQTATAPNPTKYMTFGYDEFCTVCSAGLFHYSAGLLFTGAPNAATHPNIRSLSCSAQVWPTGSSYSAAYEWAFTTGSGLVEFHFLKYASAAAMRSGSRPSVGRGSQDTGSVASGTAYVTTLSAANCNAFYNGTLNGFLVGPYTNTAGTPINDAGSGGFSYSGRLALATEGGNSTPRMVYTGSYGGSG